MTHPTAAELLELHFGELRAARAGRLAAHARSCAACRRLLDELAWAEQLLALAPDEQPPDDGLQRVVNALRAAPAAACRWRPALVAALPSAAAMLAGVLAVGFGGTAAAIVFFACGSLVTLSLAPALILEARAQGGAAAR